MGKIDLYWEPWEIESFANLQNYLTTNSMTTHRIAQLINPITQECKGELTRFDLRDTNVFIVRYNNGGGWMVVIGEDYNLETRLDELKNALGYRKLGAQI